MVAGIVLTCALLGLSDPATILRWVVTSCSLSNRRNSFGFGFPISCFGTFEETWLRHRRKRLKDLKEREVSSRNQFGSYVLVVGRWQSDRLRDSSVSSQHLTNDEEAAVEKLHEPGVVRQRA